MTDHEVATTILKQLGAHKFAVMTGSKNFSSGNQALTFQLPKNRYFRITLDSNDTYKLEYMKLPKPTSLYLWGDTPVPFKMQTIATSIGVHVEQLKSTFTSMTGLETHL